MNTFLNVFSVLGGLAMFLYGMALMSEDQPPEGTHGYLWREQEV